MHFRTGIGRTVFLSGALLLLLLFVFPVYAAKTAGFLVVAADRGFVGNEEIRDAFVPFAEKHLAELVFVTDERIQQMVQAAVKKLQEQKVDRLVVLPLFVSAAESRYQRVYKLITTEARRLPIVFAHPYGESYFAVETLAKHLRDIEQDARQQLLIIGYGAQNEADKKAMQADWERISKQASEGLDFAAVNTLILAERTKDDDPEGYSSAVKQQLTDALKSTKSAQKRVVAFGLNPKHDSMMSLESRLKWQLPKDAKLINFQIEPAQLAMWMEREANRNLPLAAEDVGVILFAHGADFHWNENLRIAVQPLMERYKIEFAFSMADPLTIERALHRLEERGAKAAVVVSAYATRNSFRSSVSHLVGLDIENQQADKAESAHKSGGHGHHGANSQSVPRILTALPVFWTGGYEDNPLFAAALFDRVLELSKEPTNETIILVAHGSVDDHQNETWLKRLQSIADHMRANGAKKFRDIKVGTWREDWPEKRKPWVKKIRDMVTEANQQNGTAIVIPARTTATGPEERFLDGLKFKLGTGFAPHPLFTQWVDDRVQDGLKQHVAALP